MARTPGMLNPMSFDSIEEFKAALAKQAAEAGWTPSPTAYPGDDDDDDDE